MCESWKNPCISFGRVYLGPYASVGSKVGIAAKPPAAKPNVRLVKKTVPPYPLKSLGNPGTPAALRPCKEGPNTKALYGCLAISVII